MTRRTYAYLSAMAFAGLGAILFLHVRAWSGAKYPAAEWPIRISTFLVFGLAYVLTPPALRRTMAHAILALPPPLLAVSAALWLYWLVSLVYFAMFELPLRDSHLWYQDLTGRFMFGWALAGVVFWANAKHARGAKE